MEVAPTKLPVCCSPLRGEPTRADGLMGDLRVPEPPAPRLWIAGYALLVLSLAVILVATGWPSFEPGVAPGGRLKLWPSPPDFARNVLLFAPLGVALRRLGLSRFAGVALAALLSIGIEAMQWLIPGRETSPWDVLANAAGAGLGMAWSVRAGSWLRPEDDTTARRLHRGASLVVALLLAGGVLLFQRTLPETAYFGHVPPDLPNLDRYGGIVEGATLSGHALWTGELPASVPWRQNLLGDHRLHVSATSGEITGGLAGLVLITDRDRIGVLIVGVRRHDLLYAVRTYSQRLGFDGGLRWVPGVIARSTARADLEIDIERRGRDLCIAVATLSSCGYGFRLGETWTHWLPARLIPPPMRRVGDALWLAGLLALVGYWGAGRARDPVPWAIASMAAGVVLLAGTTLPPDLAELTALGLGLAGGIAVARLVRRDEARPIGSPKTPE